MAGLLHYRDTGRLDAGQTVVVTVTGNGLKDTQWALQGAGEPVVVGVDAAAAAQRLGLVE